VLPSLLPHPPLRLLSTLYLLRPAACANLMTITGEDYTMYIQSYQTSNRKQALPIRRS
jgi:hypothetical protein